MKQLSLLDLPAGPKRDPDGPSLWWALRYKSMYERAVVDFVQLYEVEPVFHLDWPMRQVFVAEPGQGIIVDKTAGLLTEAGKKTLWEKDYRAAKAFRPQDVAPQITAVLSGAASRETWRPMVMAEVKVPAAKVEGFIAWLSSLKVFSQHWPVFREGYMFRVFGEPDMLDSLRYAGSSAGSPFGPSGRT